MSCIIDTQAVVVLSINVMCYWYTDKRDIERDPWNQIIVEVNHHGPSQRYKVIAGNSEYDMMKMTVI